MHKNPSIAALRASKSAVMASLLHYTHVLRFVKALCAVVGPFQHPWSAEKLSTRRKTENHKNRVFPLNRYRNYLRAIYSLRLRILSALRALGVLERVYRHL